MSFEQTLLLGLIAGATILIGLPVGRLKGLSANVRLMLSSIAVGILIFLLWDVLAQAWEPIDAALSELHEGSGSLGPVWGYGLLFIGGLSLGLLTLVWYDAWMSRRRARAVVSSSTLSAARRLALFIAAGIGLHNFAEGLAIGQSAASGDIALATLLVVGFGLHNATEGFGIVSPLTSDVDEAGQSRVPSWGFLLLLGLIGGGPTFIGTAIGYSVVSTAMSVIFLSLAAGSILYVVVQLIIVGGRSTRRDLMAYGLLLGLIAGFATDAIVTAAGA